MSSEHTQTCTDIANLLKLKRLSDLVLPQMEETLFILLSLLQCAEINSHGDQYEEIFRAIGLIVNNQKCLIESYNKYQEKLDKT